MRQPFCFIILTFGILACNETEKSPVVNRPASAREQAPNLTNVNLDFLHPVVIDSSVVVMYPLALGDKDEEEGGITGGYSKSTNYWNIVFYNTATEQYHLLDDKRKMVIYSYSTQNTNPRSSSTYEYPDTRHSQRDRLIYYSIATTDFNNDQKLNSDDPIYLFVSDKQGRNFTQVSPNNRNVASWQLVKATNKILLQVTTDSNNDKKFNENDETIPMVYDLNKKGKATNIFADDFKKSLKVTLEKQWIKEE